MNEVINEDIKLNLTPAINISSESDYDVRPPVSPIRTAPAIDSTQAVVRIVQPDVKSSRRMHRTTFQARMGRKLDNVAKRVADNNIRLTAHPTDMLRISAKRDERSGDLISRTITANEVLPIILPPLKNVPLRHFVREGGSVTIPSLYTTQEAEYIEIYAPSEVKLDVDDFLIRMIYDPNSDEPYVMCLQVVEQLATIGYSSINYLKYFAVFTNEQLPTKVIEFIKQADAKRTELGF